MNDELTCKRTKSTLRAEPADQEGHQEAELEPLSSQSQWHVELDFGHTLSGGLKRTQGIPAQHRRRREQEKNKIGVYLGVSPYF